LLLIACADYSSRPLNAPDLEAMLAGPDRELLARQSQRLSHPRLAPLTLNFTEPLTPDAVAVIAVLANPGLRALRSGQQLADAQAFAAGLLPDPQLNFGLDNVVSPKNQGLIGGTTAGLSLDVLGALATRRVDSKIARATAQQTRLDIAWQEWTTAGQARLLAIRLPALQQAARFTEDARNLADNLLQRTLQAAARGDLRADELAVQRIAAADASARFQAAARDADATRLELNRLLGLAPEEILRLSEPAELKPWVTPQLATLFAAARGARLDLQAFAAGYASQEATLRRAVLGQYPRLGIALNRSRDTSDVRTQGPSVSFDLPLWNRNRGVIAVAAATRDQMRNEYLARLHQTRADIAALIAALNRDEPARVALAAQLPDLDRVAAALADAARRGDATLVVAAAAQATALDKKLAFIALTQACAEQRLALALAIGQPLASDDFLP
jgi:outer membrane protein TolC